ncbi:MAG: DUF1992 domain-containing protein [Desulfuromonadales bacterium]|jgi:hypothetical protein
MSIFRHIAERRIQEAIQAGQLDDLALRGQPIPREDLSGVPETLRMAYKILKNSGFLPEELQLQQEILTLRDLLATCEKTDVQQSTRKRLTLRQLQLDMLMEKRGRNLADSAYQVKLRERLTRE